MKKQLVVELPAALMRALGKVVLSKPMREVASQAPLSGTDVPYWFPRPSHLDLDELRELTAALEWASRLTTLELNLAVDRYAEELKKP